MRGISACNELPATRLPVAERKLLRFIELFATSWTSSFHHISRGGTASSPTCPCSIITVRSFTRYAPLHPPRCRGLLLQNDLAQKVRCARQSLRRGEQTVLVLNRKRTVVAIHAQRGNELLPPLRAVSIAAGAEDPSPMPLICMWLGIQNSCRGKIRRIHLRVLRLAMEDRLAKQPNRGNGINALPEHVAR